MPWDKEAQINWNAKCFCFQWDVKLACEFQFPHIDQALLTDTQVLCVKQRKGFFRANAVWFFFLLRFWDFRNSLRSERRGIII